MTAIAWMLCIQVPARSYGQATTPAAAQAAGTNSAEYNRTIAAALRAYNLHHWDDALTLYEQAHALKPNARTLRGMGGCLYEMHRYVAATGALTQALLDARNPLSAEQRGTTADLLARASAVVGNVQLDMRPRDAELMVDGVRVEVPENGDLQLDPGHHELSARATGHELLIVQIDVVSGSNALTLALPAIKNFVAAAPAPVFTPVVAAPVEEAPSPRRPLKRGLIAAGAILAGVGLVSAVATGAVALKRSHDLHDTCPSHGCPESEKHTLDKARELALVSNVMWGVTALGAGICLLGILLPDGRGKSDSAKLAWGRERAAGARLQITLGGAELRGNF